MKRGHWLPLTSMLLFATTPARAGTFYIADIGAKGLGRAGAYVAAPDSLLAMHYNPAGLSLLSGLHVEADLSMNLLDFTYNRACPCVDPSRPDKKMLDDALQQQFNGHPAHTNTALYNPYLSIGYGFQWMDLTVAFSVWGPNAGRFNYNANLPPTTAPNFSMAAQGVPERYSALDVTTLEANFALGAAMQPIKGLRLGGSVIMYQNANTQSLHLWANSVTFGNPAERTDLDLPLVIDFRRNFALNWELGAIVEPASGLSIGGSFRGKRSIRSDGTVDIQLPKLLADSGATVSGRNIEIELNTAPVGRLGVQYAVPKLFKAEIAGVYEGWSVYDRVVVRPKDIELTLMGTKQKLGKIIQPRNWDNTFSLRVGGELNVLEPLVGFRAGYFFEPSGIPNDYLDVSRLDLNKHGFSVGVGTTFFGFSLEIAAMYVMMQSATVTDSKVLINSLHDRGDIAPVKPPLGSGDYLTTVGNGTYDAHYFIASASLSFALDPLLGL